MLSILFNLKKLNPRAHGVSLDWPASATDSPNANNKKKTIAKSYLAKKVVAHMYVCVCVCIRVARKGKKKSVGVHLQFVAATRRPARLPADTCPPPTTAARTFSMHVCLYVCVWILRLHALLSQLLWL